MFRTLTKRCAAIFAAAVMVLGSVTVASAKIVESTKKEVASSQSAASKWRLSQLNKTGQSIYQQFVKDLAAMRTTARATYTGTAEEAVSNFRMIVELIKTNHPEFFWISYEYSSVSAKNGVIRWEIPIYPEYCKDGKLDVAAIKAEKAQLDAVVKAVGKGKNDYDTVRRINSYMASNVRYSYSYTYPDSYEISGSLLEKSTACAGFAKGFKYLCDRLGVECIIVTGTGRLSGVSYAHEWNYVNLDGKWYLVDSTWNSLGMGTENWFLLGSSSVASGLSISRSHLPDKFCSYPALADSNYGA